LTESSYPNAPLLLFDSGVGGLSVLAEVRKLLPLAPIVYVADNAGYPYGTKTEAEIAARVPALLGRLVERYEPRLIVIACNTACTIALPHFRAALEIPIVGTVPAIKPAALSSRTRAIGVLGTQGTIRQSYVDNLSREFASDCLVLRYGSARLVDLAEAKLRGEAVAPEEVRAELDGLLGQEGGDRVDQVVLACTHFPLLLDELTAVGPPHVRFLDGAAGIARRVAYLTAGQAWPRVAFPGIAVFTRDDPNITPLKPALCTYGLSIIAPF
jgi:glutamate racemase